ncbi:MAG: Na+/H+ antiporter subunit G [Hyphomicrobium sp. 32-62-53]|nr:MAG: Na+/H+ antiporter subunit G [Hyphomicrobium sp. 12-62-95]OYX97616.1 MAG: Na+/H+ antiporter subunit G [Hyphomicrobium sp. 32-62-53]
MTMFWDAMTIVFVSTGVFFFLAGTVGLLRFPDTLTRLHALTKADTLGFGLIAIGLLPQSADVRVGLKLLVIWLILQFAGACSGQLIAQFEHRSRHSS